MSVMRIFLVIESEAENVEQCLEQKDLILVSASTPILREFFAEILLA